MAPGGGSGRPRGGGVMTHGVGSSRGGISRCHSKGPLPKHWILYYRHTPRSGGGCGGGYPSHRWGGGWYPSPRSEGDGGNFFWNIFFLTNKKVFRDFFFCTGSEPRSALEVNPVAGGTGGTPLAVTKEDFLVYYVYLV